MEPSEESSAQSAARGPSGTPLNRRRRLAELEIAELEDELEAVDALAGQRRVLLIVTGAFGTLVSVIGYIVATLLFDTVNPVAPVVMGGLLIAVMLTVYAVGLVPVTRHVTTTREKIRDRRQELRNLERQEYVESADSATVAERAPPAVPALPEPPKELVDACAEQRCVLYSGMGLGAQAGLPTGREMLARVIDEAAAGGLWLEPTDQGSLDSREFTAAITKALNAGDLNMVTELISTRLGRETLRSILRQLYPASPNQVLPPVYTALGAIPFAGVIAGDWGDLMERTFASRLADPRSVSLAIHDSINFADQFRQGFFTLVKIYGDLTRAQNFIFTANEFARAAQQNVELAKFLISSSSSRTLFFVGTSLESIEQYLNAFGARSNQRHFALVDWQPDMDIKREHFRTAWNLDLLTFVPDREYSGVQDFCATLSQRVGVRPGARVAQPQPPVTGGTLDRVELSNIGPFPSLDVHLTERWNVVLGDNGSGKSTLLKAIALGLCGDDRDARDLAPSLLRYGAQDGFIRLTVGQHTYLTELTRENDQRVRVESRGFTRLQHGDWAVVGFPSVRGAPLREIRGPQADAARRQPVVEDLLPILTGRVDDRIDDIKQWIVNVYSRPNARGARVPSRQSLNQINSFFGFVGNFMPGLKLEFGDVTPEYDVLVKTNDGTVPIELISQGMSSILGWVGTLTQRMSAIYRESKRPQREAALVIIDELDAHMHPSWEYQLVSTLSEHFPNVQFIATTHSPLIVSNMDPASIVLLYEGQQVKWESEYEPRTMGVAGLLTSQAFRLRTELPPEIQLKLDRRNALYLKAVRTEPEDAEMRRLSDELASAGFMREFRDPMYQALVRALDRPNAREKPSLTPDEIKEQDAIANRIVDEVLSEDVR